jgi:hypothetical protein
MSAPNAGTYSSILKQVLAEARHFCTFKLSNSQTAAAGTEARHREPELTACCMVCAWQGSAVQRIIYLLILRLTNSPTPTHAWACIAVAEVQQHGICQHVEAPSKSFELEAQAMM